LSRPRAPKSRQIPVFRLHRLQPPGRFERATLNDPSIPTAAPYECGMESSQVNFVFAPKCPTASNARTHKLKPCTSICSQDWLTMVSRRGLACDPLETLVICY
jgi:hypothetical protein